MTGALLNHQNSEKASFHTPGHKSRARLSLWSSGSLYHGDDEATENNVDLILPEARKFDITETGDLDDLSYPQGLLKKLEERLARLYCAHESIISVTGGSGGILATILALSSRGSRLLVPRNAHRAVIHALVLSGMEPVWYESKWNEEWGLYEEVTTASLEQVLKAGGTDDLAGVLVTSPTYSGIVSDIKNLADFAHSLDLPLIVDEAHGAHFLTGTGMPESACRTGADLVIHSLHKTLGALTQTGAVHVVSERYVSADSVRASMRLVTTSSPSYILLASIEETVLIHEQTYSQESLRRLSGMAADLRIRLARYVRVYCPQSVVDPLHILIAHPSWPGSRLSEYLIEHGIYCEAVLGAGCLLLLGVLTENEDCELVVSALKALLENAGAQSDATSSRLAKPASIKSAMSLRAASLGRTQTLKANEALGRISADCFAPCPPGVPVLVPGAIITAEALSHIDKSENLRVVLETE